MKKRKCWVVILVIFLVLFYYEGSGIYKDIYIEYNSPEYINEIANEYNKLNVQEKKKYSVEKFVEIKKNKNIISEIFIGTLNIFFTIITKYILIFSILISIYLVENKYHKTKLSSIDFDNKNIYYRDILNKYSVDLLGFIDHIQFNYPDILIAMLLQLQMKGVLRIENNGIYLNHNIDLNSLSNNEKYLIRNINNNKLIIDNIKDYEQLVIDEGIDKGLLENNELNNIRFFKINKSSSAIFYVILLIFILYLIFLYINKLPIGDNLVFLALVAFCILSFMPIFILIYIPLKFLIYYSKITENPYFRTKTSEEINKKLEGLKNFVKDFSKLEERENKEIILWDEYLIYSVLFGHNKKIINEYKHLILFLIANNDFL